MNQPTKVQWMNFGKTAAGVIIIVAGAIKIWFPDASEMIDMIFAPLVRTVALAVPLDPNWTPDGMTMIVAGLGVSGFGILDKIRKWLRAHPSIAAFVNRVLAAKYPALAAMLVDPPPAFDLDAIRRNEGQ